ncbi:uncharacterized protein LOC111795298 [Cucurbita pepo subsp. pepo]|uniref:uncharacterized protein LOC111795298 n=1 Tax=Cucurbita pepo subsp. pepo TaxID=3664 RepID=UPI000C9D5D68|nr:uncharacterized protein LOC111795298 [Cucurbita pepo subsp. pepo]
MKLVGVLVCLLVVAMDIVAGLLAIEADIAQNKVKHLRLWIFECRDPSEQAFKLGLGAAGLLGLAHIIANLLGGFNCICSKEELEKSPPNKQISIGCLVFTWIIVAVGMSLLVIGALANSKSRTSCGFSHHHFLSMGGILCFVHGLFCVAYYVSSTVAY